MSMMTLIWEVRQQQDHSLALNCDSVSLPTPQMGWFANPITVFMFLGAVLRKGLRGVVEWFMRFATARPGFARPVRPCPA